MKVKLMPRRGQWTAPADDKTIILAHATTHDPRDPRALGQGPCGDRHLEPLEANIRHKIDGLKWSANQYGRWAICGMCALRLVYYPREGHVGRYRVNESAATVTTALHLLAERNSRNNCNHKAMKTFLELATAEIKLVKNQGPTPPQETTNEQGPTQGQQAATTGTTQRRRSVSARRTTTTAAGSSAAAAASSTTPAVDLVTESVTASAVPESDEGEVVGINKLRQEVLCPASCLAHCRAGLSDGRSDQQRPASRVAHCRVGLSDGR